MSSPRDEKTSAMHATIVVIRPSKSFSCSIAVVEMSCEALDVGKGIAAADGIERVAGAPLGTGDFESTAAPLERDLDADVAGVASTDLMSFAEAGRVGGGVTALD